MEMSFYLHRPRALDARLRAEHEIHSILFIMYYSFFGSLFPYTNDWRDVVHMSLPTTLLYVHSPDYTQPASVVNAM
jgi:hypothetical protein